MVVFTLEQIARAKANGVSKSTLYSRERIGWDIEKAITTPPRKTMTPSLEYSEEKLQRVRKQFGNELTYSVYKRLKEYGFSDKEIRTMYELGKNELYDFIKNHKEKLEEAK